MWSGIAGITLLAIALTVAAMGLSWATLFNSDPQAEAREKQFGQCYNGGQNCVFDGDTIRVDGEKLQIAGMTAPQIQGAQCEAERTRGIDAAVQLAILLNSGTVTLGEPFRDETGREVRKVQVDGADVAAKMISSGAAEQLHLYKPDWCPSSGGSNDASA